MAKAKKLPSGNWRVQVYSHTDENRKRHYKSFTASTKKEAEYMAAEYQMSSHRDLSYEDLTLREAYERYIDSKSAILSPSTIAEYTRMKNKHFQNLMPMKLSKIKAGLIQTAINEMSASSSPKTVRNAHGLLHSVLKAYCPGFEFSTTLPQKVKPKYIIPTTEEINKLLDNANDKIRVPILLASHGGLRRSEICALTAEDFTELGVNVTKACVYDESGSMVVKTTKTIAGTRFVPLPKNVINECRNWEYFGCSPKTLSTRYDRLCEKVDVPKFSFHKLRHYFASELHAQGIPDQYIAKIGGWESVEMLHRIYQHTLRDREDDILNKIVNIFNQNFQKISHEISHSKKVT